MDEQKLVQLAVLGQSEAVGQLYDLYFVPTYRFFYWQTNRQQHEAEDLTQETFVEMAKSIRGFKAKSSFKNWLYAIAKNRLKQWLKRKYRQSSQPLFESIEDTPVWIDPDNQARKVKQVEALLTTLAPQEKKVMELRYLLNYSVAETAKETGLSQANVKVLAHRTIKKLQNRV